MMESLNSAYCLTGRIAALRIVNSGELVNKLSAEKSPVTIEDRELLRWRVSDSSHCLEWGITVCSGESILRILEYSQSP
jgi:hypothetical protein